jgi:hypothetical protein
MFNGWILDRVTLIEVTLYVIIDDRLFVFKLELVWLSLVSAARFAHLNL